MEYAIQYTDTLKQIINIWKIEDEESSYIQYLDANNLYGWAMSQKLPVNGFKWIDSNKINEEFIKNYNENNKERYILEVDVKYPKKLLDSHSDYHSYREE